MTRVLIELAWFIGCSLVLGFLFVALIVMLTSSHYDDDKLENVFKAMWRTLLMTISLMLMIIPHSEVAMDMFLYVYNFLRMCFGDNMRGIGRLQWYLRGAGTESGSLFFPLFFFTFIFCFIRHLMTAQKGERTTALKFLPCVVIVEFIMLMCIADRVITLLIGMLVFASVIMNVKLAIPIDDESKKLSDKGFTKSYMSKDLGYFTASNIFGSYSSVMLTDICSGREIIAYKNIDGTLHDENGNTFYPDYFQEEK